MTSWPSATQTEGQKVAATKYYRGRGACSQPIIYCKRMCRKQGLKRCTGCETDTAGVLTARSLLKTEKQQCD